MGFCFILLYLICYILLLSLRGPLYSERQNESGSEGEEGRGGTGRSGRRRNHNQQSIFNERKNKNLKKKEEEEEHTH